MQAQTAAQMNEVPIGAVITHDNQLIASGYNCPISQQDPCAHAEIMAIKAAADNQANYRLLNTTLYVTVEPCMMCVGAMTHARIDRVVFGCSEPKAGALCSQLHYEELTFLNHRFTFEGGILEESCRNLIQSFFKDKR